MAEWASKTTAGVEADSGSAGQVLAFEDAAVLKCVRQGETAAFGQLVKKYQDRLFNAILRMCGNRDDAEELCQETFVKALENLSRFRQDSRLYTWLFRIAMNLTISHRRHAARGRFASLEAGGPDGELSAQAQDLVADHHQVAPPEAVERQRNASASAGGPGPVGRAVPGGGGAAGHGRYELPADSRGIEHTDRDGQEPAVPGQVHVAGQIAGSNRLSRWNR